MVNTEAGNLAYDAERQYIGTVYGKALLGATSKSNNTDSVLAELDDILGNVLVKLPRLRLLLESPRVPLEVKERVIETAFGKASRELRNFFKVVCLHGRFDCLRVVARTARDLRNDEIDRLAVRVTTAEPITEEIKKQIAAQLGTALGKTIELHHSVDPSIIGGLVVRIGDTVYDTSLANSLARVKRVAFEKAVLEIKQALPRFAV